MSTVGLKATWDATGGVVIADKATSTSIMEIDAANKQVEFNIIESNTLKCNGKSVVYTLNAYMADGGTAGSVYVVAPVAGTIVKLSAVNYAANETTKTVLTGFIVTDAITHTAWEIGATAAAGTATAVTPSGANTVTAGQVIKLTTDGGSSSTMPVMFTVTIQL